MSDLFLNLNFWQAKQLEYWLKDNYPNCRISVVDSNNYCPPEIKEYYRVSGDVDIDLTCMLKLKYGKDVEEHINNG